MVHVSLQLSVDLSLMNSTSDLEIVDFFFLRLQKAQGVLLFLDSVERIKG